MKNIRLYEAEVDYTSDPIEREYPTVSYCKETDTIYFVKSSAFEFVDLGLSVQWATCNVGATKPEEFGLYFAWGDTQGYTGITDEKQFTWADYTLCDGTSSNMLKYNATDELLTLEEADDAAAAVDKGCRIPTSGECKELTANTTSEWIDNYNESGVKGMLFTSNNNGNSIFVPAAGYCGGGSVGMVGEYGFLWSSSRPSYRNSSAECLGFASNDMYIDNKIDRCYGFSVRPVKK